MKNIICYNTELMEVLIAHGIEITCSLDMEQQVSEEDAKRIPEIVEEYAWDARFDYVLEP